MVSGDSGTILDFTICWQPGPADEKKSIVDKNAGMGMIGQTDIDGDEAHR